MSKLKFPCYIVRVTKKATKFNWFRRDLVHFDVFQSYELALKVFHAQVKNCPSSCVELLIDDGQVQEVNLMRDNR